MRDWDLEKGGFFFFTEEEMAGRKSWRSMGGRAKKAERERERGARWTVDRWINSLVGNMRWESVEV